MISFNFGQVKIDYLNFWVCLIIEIEIILKKKPRHGTRFIYKTTNGLNSFERN